MKFSKDELIILSQGEYNDYSLIAPTRALRDFDSDAAWLEFNQVVEMADRLGNDLDTDPDAFTEWLIKTGYLTEIVATELHLGSNGNTKPEVRGFAGSVTEECAVCSTPMRSWDLQSIPTGYPGYPIRRLVCSMCAQADQIEQAARGR